MLTKIDKRGEIKQMIKDKITLDDVEEAIVQYTDTERIDLLNIPTIERSGEYNSLKPRFDKLSGSRSRCFCTGFFKHSFSELVEAERIARGTKLSQNDVINLFERLSQILKSFFAEHSKGDLRSEYAKQYHQFLRSNYKH